MSQENHEQDQTSNSSLSLTEKRQQFEEFFSIEHEFNVNIKPLAKSVSPEIFEQYIPVPFLLSTDNATIDQSALRSIQSMRGVSNQLTDYLMHQSRKIDLLVGYILQQHDDAEHRAQGILFGGSGLKIVSEQDFEVGQLVELKVFLDIENVAIYCHGEVIEKAVTGSDNQYTLTYQQIREVDQDILVRSSLHIQAKQLQALSQERRKNQQS